MKRILLPVTAAALLALTACSGQPVVTPASDSPAAPATTTEAATDAAPSGSHKYGDTATWPDGVAITMSAPKPYKPGEYAAKPDVAEFVSVDVTLLNGSSEPIETHNVYVRATSGDSEAEKVYEDGIGDPSSRVLPGKTLRWVEAFGRPEDDLIVTVSWQFGAPVTFQQ